MATATYDEAGKTYEDTTLTYDGMPFDRGLSLLIGPGEARTDFTDVLDLNTAAITDSGTGARSLAAFSLRTSLAASPHIKDQALVMLVGHGTDPDVFRGFIRSRHPTTGINAMLEVIADDIGGLLDDAFIPSVERPAETMVARITYLWNNYASTFLSSDLSNVASIGGTLPAQDFVRVTLRQAIEMTIAQASPSAKYYVDPDAKLHVFTSSATAAPYAVRVGTPGAGEIAPEHLDIDYDSNSYANRVYIAGATPAGSGFFQDNAAITAAGGLVRTAHMDAPDCETQAMAQALANMYLGRVGSPLARGVFTTSTPYDGWRADQNVTVTEPDIGLSAQSFRIANVTTTFTKTQASYRRNYRVEFGASRSGGATGGAESLGTGQLVSGQLGGASNVYVTADGVSVTDGTRVRAHIGRLANGSYGITITDSSGNVLIDGNQITITGSTGSIGDSQISSLSASKLTLGTVAAGIALGIQQTTVTSAGLKVTTGGNDRVIAGDIGGGVYGLKVVATDGTTTIIDGTSNVFKIQASGSMSLTLPARTTTAVVNAQTEVTLTALGTQSTIPAHLSFVGPSLNTTDKRWIGGNNMHSINAHVSNEADGSTGHNFLALFAQGMMATYLNGSNQVVVRLGGENANDFTAYTREGIYHILKEAAL